MHCNQVLRRGHWVGVPADHVSLDYEQRFLRRKRLVSAGGISFVVDLAEMASLEEGDALPLLDGRVIVVHAEAETVARVTGDLARLAWHIGNRHTPCQIETDHLIIRRDPVLEQMLRGLGAGLSFAIAPFRPEGGAYGLGRTMGHDHAAPPMALGLLYAHR
jgi:urease accessory protein